MRSLRYLPIMIILLVLAAVSLALAGPNMGAADNPSAGTFIPFYGSGSAGSFVPASVTITATAATSCKVSGWDWNGTAWSKIWPTTAFGLAAADTALPVPAGASLMISLQYQSCDAVYISGNAADQVIWND